MNAASAPRPRSSASRALPSVSRRPETTRRAPSLAKAMAVARPMPVRAPVIKTTGFFMALLLERWPAPDGLACRRFDPSSQDYDDVPHRRGGEPDGCGRAAAAHLAALAQPADPRSGVRGRG